MLAMIKKGIRGKLCHSINRYAKAYKKYMKDCGKNREILRCKQFVWLGNVTKTACKWI